MRLSQFRSFARVFIALMAALSIGLLFAGVNGLRVSEANNDFAALALYSAIALVVSGILFVWLVLIDLRQVLQRVQQDASVQRSMSAVNASLVEQQHNQIEQLALLNEVVATLSGSLSPDTLVEHIISCASVLTDATGYTIYVNTSDRFELARSVGLRGLQIIAVTDPLMIQVGVSTEDRAEQSMLVISDLGSDPRAAKIRVSGVQHHFRSVIELPLLSGGELLGMMGLYYTRRVAADDPRLELLRTFTTQAAQALYNARQYVEANEAFQRNAERLMTLAVLSRSLSSSIDVESMCEQVLDEVLLATGAGAGILVLLDDDNSTPQMGAVRGLPPDQEQYSAVAAALERIDPASGAYVVRRDTHSVGLPPFLTETAQSMLIVPMVQSSFLFGAIWLESTSTEVFDSEDIRFVEQISNQAVIALENARLFQRLEGDRERLARLLDTMVEGIMMIDRQGDVVLANPRMNLVKLPPESLLNTNFIALLEDSSLNFARKVGFASHEEAAAFVIEMERHLAAPEVKTYTIDVGGSARAVERKIVPVTSSDRVLGLMLVFYDRTDQKELERSREELANMIVHDLRSPLTAVTTSLRLLHDMIPQDSKFWPVVESTTEVSRRAVKKILNRVNSLLDIAKLESGGITIVRENITFARLTETVIEEINPLAKEMQIQLRVDGVGESPTLSVDIDKTERVLLNFVDNALKYSAMQTTVTIRHHQPEADESGKRFVRIDIADQGPGIPPEYKTRLFESFVQVEGRRSSRGGVGLGLTFAKLTVEAHGGRIWIEDNPGGGSIFAFTLPVAE